MKVNIQLVLWTYSQLTLDRCEECKRLCIEVNKGWGDPYQQKKNAWTDDLEEHLNMVHAF